MSKYVKATRLCGNDVKATVKTHKQPNKLSFYVRETGLNCTFVLNVTRTINGRFTYKKIKWINDAFMMTGARTSKPLNVQRWHWKVQKLFGVLRFKLKYFEEKILNPRSWRCNNLRVSWDFISHLPQKTIS